MKQICDKNIAQYFFLEFKIIKTSLKGLKIRSSAFIQWSTHGIF